MNLVALGVHGSQPVQARMTLHQLIYEEVHVYVEPHNGLSLGSIVDTARCFDRTSHLIYGHWLIHDGGSAICGIRKHLAPPISCR